MEIVLVGPGRAGLALSLAMQSAGHRIAGVLGRTAAATDRAASFLGAGPLRLADPWPSADLLLIAVRDDDLPAVAEALAGRVGSIGAAVHCSGLTPVGVLAPLGAIPQGSFHPLQTLPNAEVGAARLAGAWVAVTATDALLADRLDGLARSIEMHPFRLADGDKPVYHAAAAAAANFPIAAFAMAERLFTAAGVPFDAARPLVEAVVANAFELSPLGALTGPIARGDVGTVAAQLEAVEGAAPDLRVHFAAFGRAVAALAGTHGSMDDVLR